MSNDELYWNLSCILLHYNCYVITMSFIITYILLLSKCFILFCPQFNKSYYENQHGFIHLSRLRRSTRSVFVCVKTFIEPTLYYDVSCLIWNHWRWTREVSFLDVVMVLNCCDNFFKILCCLLACLHLQILLCLLACSYRLQIMCSLLA